jgi:transposase
MTYEQINAAIAEACGWTNVSARHRSGRCPGADDLYVGHEFLPDYCSDLNAMHEAEKTLTKEQVSEYQCYMYDMACEISATQGRWMPYSATARYRAEAFLKALGKWEEAE